MRKLQSARDALLAAPLGIKAKNLLTFAEKGSVVSSRGGRNGNFRITYTANLIVTDYAGEPQDLLFVLLTWLQAECPNAKEDAIAFHVDIIDHRKADVSLAVELSDLIQVRADETGHWLEAQSDADALAIDMQALYPDLPETGDGTE